MSRNVLVALVGLLVFLVVAGAVYLQIVVSARQADTAWAVTSSVTAGDQLSGANARQVHIPRTGDSWDYFTGELGQARVAHDMAAGTVIFNSDILQADLALVTLSLKTPPPLSRGQTVDVYALVSNQTQMVGRRLPVEKVDGASCSVWVPAGDEPAWITLEASNTALFAARSTGVGVPQTRNQNISDALSTLSGASVGSGPASRTSLPTPTPR